MSDRDERYFSRNEWTYAADTASSDMTIICGRSKQGKRCN